MYSATDLCAHLFELILEDMSEQTKLEKEKRALNQVRVRATVEALEIALLTFIYTILPGPLHQQR